MILEAIEHCRIIDESCAECPARKDIYICENVSRMGVEFAEMLIKELESEDDGE